MRVRIHSLMIEGIIFCGSGLALLSYSLYSHARAFNKAWSQSPYLFPLVVAAALLALSANLILSGWRAAGAEEPASPGPADNRAPGDASPDPADDRPLPVTAGVRMAKPDSAVQKSLGVLAVLAICALYYAALAYLKFPYVAVGILSFQYTFSTFEVATVLFLAAMMGYMGVRKPLILALVPLGTTLFLSVTFRTLLHVLLP